MNNQGRERIVIFGASIRNFSTNYIFAFKRKMSILEEQDLITSVELRPRISCAMSMRGYKGQRMLPLSFMRELMIF